MYSAARRDATHYPHPAHIPKFGIRLGAPFHRLRNVIGAGKLMFQCHFSIRGARAIVRLLGTTLKRRDTPSALTRKSLNITNAACLRRRRCDRADRRQMVISFIKHVASRV